MSGEITQSDQHGQMKKKCFRPVLPAVLLDSIKFFLINGNDHDVLPTGYQLSENSPTIDTCTNIEIRFLLAFYNQNVFDNVGTTAFKIYNAMMKKESPDDFVVTELFSSNPHFQDIYNRSYYFDDLDQASKPSKKQICNRELCFELICVLIWNGIPILHYFDGRVINYSYKPTIKFRKKVAKEKTVRVQIPIPKPLVKGVDNFIKYGNFDMMTSKKHPNESSYPDPVIDCSRTDILKILFSAYGTDYTPEGEEIFKKLEENHEERISVDFRTTNPDLINLPRETIIQRIVWACVWYDIVIPHYYNGYDLIERAKFTKMESLMYSESLEDAKDEKHYKKIVKRRKQRLLEKWKKNNN